ncbi:hypothetical protein LCGC14_3052390, partial [marine sediment metagenome]
GGFGPEGYILPGVMAYEVEFENDPDVGAELPAQEVFITDLLDDDLDLSTVEFTSFAFNNRVWQVPPGLSHYDTALDLRPEGIDLLVTVEMDVDPDSRMLSVTFRSLDPITNQLPDDPDAGFLPVNTAAHDGEGFFTYLVSPASTVTGTVITNQADIVFDVNESILTPITTHTFDAGSPTSSPGALAASQLQPTFDVSWTGSDDAGGSGIGSYDVYVSDDGGPWSLWQDDTPASSATFSGQTGHTYAFYSVATDNVGHVEGKSPSAEATTYVNVPPAVGALLDTSDPVARPGLLALEAQGVSDADGTPVLVEFYDDANDNDLLEPGVDTLIGTDTNGADGWSISVNTTGWTLGQHT